MENILFIAALVYVWAITGLNAHKAGTAYLEENNQPVFRHPLVDAVGVVLATPTILLALCVTIPLMVVVAVARNKPRKLVLIPVTAHYTYVLLFQGKIDPEIIARA